MKSGKCFPLILLTVAVNLPAEPWIADLGNGRYKNPILFADYSDPDVVRVGDDFYLVASSFNCMPGIPVLHSRDLVNWTIIGHVYERLPFEKYDKPAHGQGSWAPSIRYRNGLFYVYFCTPHDGLFMATTKDPAGEWTLRQVADVELWEDPCPFWDDDGKAYLIRSKLHADILYLHRMSDDGTTLLDNGVVLYRDEASQPVIEGPKFLKKDGIYYIFAPAGGVAEGWQTVLRSKAIDGPYEAKVVLHQGNTEINGPHQGGIVELKSGEWWFVHFQDRGAYGRVVHLQPVTWKDGWPLIGMDINNDGIGEPVSEYKNPDITSPVPIDVPQTTDEFNASGLGPQWQWHANPRDEWCSMTRNPGNLRLSTLRTLSQNGNLWFAPNLLLQKFPAPSFTATTRIDFHPDRNNEKSGLVVMGKEWACLALTRTETGLNLVMDQCAYSREEDKTRRIASLDVTTSVCYLKVQVDTLAVCVFSYSMDGIRFQSFGEPFTAVQGMWIGAKVGLFHINPNMAESRGFSDFDWFRVE